MKTKVSLCLSCLLLTSASLEAQEIKYVGGSGTILEGTKSADGEFAVVLTEAGNNVVVNLRERAEVLKLTAEDDWQFPYFPGLNHGSLDVTWGPDQEGSRFGVLIFGAKWETAKAFLIEVDPERGSQTNLMPVLNDAALKWARASGAQDPDGLSFTYTVTGVDAPGGDMVITDPLDIRVEYYGEIPKAEEETGTRGTLKLRLTRTGKGLVAKEIGAGGAVAPVANQGGLDAEHFSEVRDVIRKEVAAGGLKKVKVHRPGETKGRTLSYMGHVEANVLKRLVYVDSENDDNETFLIYYWVDGLLVSATEVRKGMDTEMSEIARTSETYNFDKERLVGWIRDGEAVDPDTESFAQLGFGVLEQSIERAGVIYAEIGAD